MKEKKRSRQVQKFAFLLQTIGRRFKSRCLHGLFHSVFRLIGSGVKDKRIHQILTAPHSQLPHCPLPSDSPSPSPLPRRSIICCPNNGFRQIRRCCIQSHHRAEEPWGSSNASASQAVLAASNHGCYATSGAMTDASARLSRAVFRTSAMRDSSAGAVANF